MDKMVRRLLFVALTATVLMVLAGLVSADPPKTSSSVPQPGGTPPQGGTPLEYRGDPPPTPSGPSQTWVGSDGKLQGASQSVPGQGGMWTLTWTALYALAWTTVRRKKQVPVYKTETVTGTVEKTRLVRREVQVGFKPGVVKTLVRYDTKVEKRPTGRFREWTEKVITGYETVKERVQTGIRRWTETVQQGLKSVLGTVIKGYKTITDHVFVRNEVKTRTVTETKTVTETVPVKKQVQEQYIAGYTQKWDSKQKRMVSTPIYGTKTYWTTVNETQTKTVTVNRTETYTEPVYEKRTRQEPIYGQGVIQVPNMVEVERSEPTYELRDKRVPIEKEIVHREEVYDEVKQEVPVYENRPGLVPDYRTEVVEEKYTETGTVTREVQVGTTEIEYDERVQQPVFDGWKPSWSFTPAPSLGSAILPVGNAGASDTEEGGGTTSETAVTSKDKATKAPSASSGSPQAPTSVAPKPVSDEVILKAKVLEAKRSWWAEWVASIGGTNTVAQQQATAVVQQAKEQAALKGIPLEKINITEAENWELHSDALYLIKNKWYQSTDQGERDRISYLANYLRSERLRLTRESSTYAALAAGEGMQANGDLSAAQNEAIRLQYEGAADAALRARFEQLVSAAKNGWLDKMPAPVPSGSGKRAEEAVTQVTADFAAFRDALTTWWSYVDAPDKIDMGVATAADVVMQEIVAKYARLGLTFPGRDDWAQHKEKLHTLDTGFRSKVIALWDKVGEHKHSALAAKSASVAVWLRHVSAENQAWYRSVDSQNQAVLSAKEKRWDLLKNLSSKTTVGTLQQYQSDLQEWDKAEAQARKAGHTLQDVWYDWEVAQSTLLGTEYQNAYRELLRLQVLANYEASDGEGSPTVETQREIQRLEAVLGVMSKYVLDVPTRREAAKAQQRENVGRAPAPDELRWIQAFYGITGEKERYGAATRAAVASLQKANGITPDDWVYVGTKTFAALEKAYTERINELWRQGKGAEATRFIDRVASAGGNPTWVADMRMVNKAYLDHLTAQESLYQEILTRATRITGWDDPATFAAVEAAKSRLQAAQDLITKSGGTLPKLSPELTETYEKALRSLLGAALPVAETANDWDVENLLAKLDVIKSGNMWSIGDRVSDAASPGTLWNNPYRKQARDLSDSQEKALGQGIISLIERYRPELAPEVPRNQSDSSAVSPASASWLQMPMANCYLTTEFQAQDDLHDGEQHALHTGVDLVADDPIIRAGASGKVVFAGAAGNYGNLVVLDHGNGYCTYYAHLDSFDKGLEVGSRVAAGDELGIMGSTGRGDGGKHLHFEVRQGTWDSTIKNEPWTQLGGNGIISPWTFLPVQGWGVNFRRLIEDSQFTDTSITEEQIERILEYKDCLTFKGRSRRFPIYEQNGEEPAMYVDIVREIKTACDANGINPLLLLARMQIEQSLLTGDVDPRSPVLEWGLGNAAYGTGQRDPKDAGLVRQIHGAAQTLASRYSQASKLFVDGKPHLLSGLNPREVRNGHMEPERTSSAVIRGTDGTWTIIPNQVGVENAATWALYRYTPHLIDLYLALNLKKSRDNFPDEYDGHFRSKAGHELGGGNLLFAWSWELVNSWLR